MVASLRQKSNQDLHKLSIQHASISVSEPIDSPLSATDPMLTMLPNSIHSATPSPPPPISISAGSPPASPQSLGFEEKESLLFVNNNHPATITEELQEQDEGIVMNSKSSLSLPVEQPATMHSPTNVQSNPSGNHVKALPERSQSDRRKLSVTNIMGGFGERRRSTSSIFSDMRKMSITNFDNLKSPGVGK